MIASARSGFIRGLFQNLAQHLNVDVDTIRPLLAVWISKGKVRKQVGDFSTCKGCCQCHPATMETYQWLE